MFVSAENGSVILINIAEPVRFLHQSFCSGSNFGKSLYVLGCYWITVPYLEELPNIYIRGTKGNKEEMCKLTVTILLT